MIRRPRLWPWGAPGQRSRWRKIARRAVPALLALTSQTTDVSCPRVRSDDGIGEGLKDLEFQREPATPGSSAEFATIPWMGRLSWSEVGARAIRFSKEWADARSERSDKQTFWNEFFEVFGIPRKSVATFEVPVKKRTGHMGAIDLFWPGHLLVEHKSRGEDLKKAEGQAFDYARDLPAQGRADEAPRYILVSDFEHVALFDMAPPDVGPLFRGHEHVPLYFPLKELDRHVRAFGFMLGLESVQTDPKDPANKKAFALMCELHDALELGGFAGRDLERLLVRVLYCLFADHTGVFAPRTFESFITSETREDGSDLAARLNEFFYFLDTPPSKRPAGADPQLDALPHVNGQLFKDRLGFPRFTGDMRRILLRCAGFQWARISPAIFGSLFQGVLDKEERRELGAHYTSERDVLRLIGPLFLDDLRVELERLKSDKSPQGVAALEKFHRNLRSLRFLDPACGCGSFLIVAYRELRTLELNAVVAMRGDSKVTAADMPKLFRVNVDQFYGVELEEWPARIAEVALWLTDHQANLIVSERMGEMLQRLPLVTSPQIEIGNALQVDWSTVLPASDCTYLLGNPPFSGQQTRSAEQTKDLRDVWGSEYGRWLDYVTGWYRKACDYVSEARCRAAFVSTNSISQGEQVARLWRPLLRAGFEIDFAHRTFRWMSEARNKAVVYCVIIGFSVGGRAKKKRLFEYDDIDGEPTERAVEQINPYLVAAPNVLVEDRSKPISTAIPLAIYGNKPTDGGHLLVEDGEKPIGDRIAMKYLRPLLGARELLHNEPRWCLWLLDAKPQDITGSAFIRDRVAKVRKFRAESTSPDTRKYAAHPSRFFRIPQPHQEYIGIPRHVSEDRRWFTVGHFDPNVIASDAIFTAVDPDGFLFGILSSAMFIAWLRNVGGAIKSDLRFSNLMVYNTFPLDEPTEKVRKSIIDAGKAVLEVRSRYTGTALADMYNPDAIPSPLVRAHEKLDRAVDAAYRDIPFASDSERASHLFTMYDALIQKQKAAAQAPRKRQKRATPPAKTDARLYKTSPSTNPSPQIGTPTPVPPALRSRRLRLTPLPPPPASSSALVASGGGRRKKSK